jgi:DtxR family Mn-dependent transcriptional regulator
MHTTAVEDYLKSIYEISRHDGRVTTSALAELLSVAPASATGMIKKLSSMKLVTYEPYKGVELTDGGRKIALEVIRHHRLVELYLSEALGVPWDQVHEEAEKWEHVLSEDLEDRMDAALGHPKSDPHGAPIPNRDGAIEEFERTLLAELNAGDQATIAEVNDHDPALLRYLGKLGLYPKTIIQILSIEPFEGPIRISINGKEESLGLEAARHVYVKDVQASESNVKAGKVRSK